MGDWRVVCGLSIGLLAGCGRLGFEPVDLPGDAAMTCVPSMTTLVPRSDAGPSLARTPDGVAVAWADAGVVRLALVARDGRVTVPFVEVGTGSNPLLGTAVSRLALVTAVEGGTPKLTEIGFDGVLVDTQELPEIVAPAVRGVPHTGESWMLGASDAAGRMVLQAIPKPPRPVAPAGTWITVAWNGRVLGYSWREGTVCYVRAFDAMGLPRGLRRTVATSCYDPEISARENGFAISYHTDGVRRPHLITVDDDGNAITSDVDVGPPPVEIQYRHVVNASTGKLTYLVMSEVGTKPAPDWIATVDARGIAAAPPFRIDAYAQRHDILGLDDQLVVAWRGGTSDATSLDTGIHVMQFCP